MVYKKKTKLVSTCVIDGRGKNLFISLVRPNGEIISYASAGKLGLKGPKKKTFYAAELTGRMIGAKALKLQIGGLFIQIKGKLSKNVKAAITGLSRKGLRILELEVLNIQSHNVVRLKKIRRK